jgi:hypothetical protein
LIAAALMFASALSQADALERRGLGRGAVLLISALFAASPPSSW